MIKWPSSYSNTVSAVSCVGADVGALRKHAGGMFLASDLGSYAAVAAILILKALSYVRADRVARPYRQVQKARSSLQSPLAMKSKISCQRF